MSQDGDGVMGGVECDFVTDGINVAVVMGDAVLGVDPGACGVFGRCGAIHQVVKMIIGRIFSEVFMHTSTVLLAASMTKVVSEIESPIGHLCWTI